MNKLQRLYEIQSAAAQLAAEEKQLKKELSDELGPGLHVQDNFVLQISVVDATVRTDYKKLALSFKTVGQRIAQYQTPVKATLRVNKVKKAS